MGILMVSLVNEVKKLQNTKIAEVISLRLDEFTKVSDLFSELCFCLMTANFRAEKCIEIQSEIGDGFKNMSEEDLALKLKEMGHRFWPQRAKRIVEARSIDLKGVGGLKGRDFLVGHVNGLGMKEASHFLRNIGVKDIGIVDFHIVDLLVRERLMERPKSKSFTKKKYLEIEEILRSLGKKLGLSLAELDLYLWYIETGKILK